MAPQGAVCKKEQALPKGSACFAADRSCRVRLPHRLKCGVCLECVVVAVPDEDAVGNLKTACAVFIDGLLHDLAVPGCGVRTAVADDHEPAVGVVHTITVPAECAAHRPDIGLEGGAAPGNLKVQRAAVFGDLHRCALTDAVGV